MLRYSYGDRKTDIRTHVAGTTIGNETQDILTHNRGQRERCHAVNVSIHKHKSTQNNILKKISLLHFNNVLTAQTNSSFQDCFQRIESKLKMIRMMGFWDDLMI